jgi:hypothetical protein
VLSQEWLSEQPQAQAAGASVHVDAGTRRVGAVTADEPPISISDHRPELDARYAMWAADGQGCVSQQWVLLNTSKRRWHVRFQTSMPSDPDENHEDRQEPTKVSSRNPDDIWSGVPTGGRVTKTVTKSVVF